jgi:hypothetical protein
MLLRRALQLVLATLAGALVVACGSNGGPTTPSPPPTTPPPTTSQFEITTLITVYRNAEADAQWSRGTTNDARIGQILLGVSDLSTAIGSTNLNNEGARVQLQAAIDRLRNDFSSADYMSAFDETQKNLERYLNDADDDGWSIDGRHGTGRDWPYDGPNNHNDPDGWTAQIVVSVSRM